MLLLALSLLTSKRFTLQLTVTVSYSWQIARKAEFISLNLTDNLRRSASLQFLLNLNSNLTRIYK
jgi:hypothetical protein